MRNPILSTPLLALAAAGMIASTAASAQTTVSVGQGYANEVYYDLQNGVVRTEPLNAWDIAFQVQGYASSIMINGGAGVTLYSVPGKTVEEWSQPLDTTGMAASWSSWHNSFDTWEGGAFNMETDYNTGNFGWGEYNMNTHVVSGTTLYVINLPDKSTKKIMVEGLSGGTYTFKYANLDGSNEVTATLPKSEFSGKNFGYYSIREGKVVDHEPAIAEWDLLFGKYTDLSNDMPYVVTGVRANMGVTVAAVESETPATVAAPSDDAYTTKITEIGYDWKTFTGTTYAVNDKLAFFVKDQGGSIYRIVFTGFGGSSTGNFVFNQELLGASSVKDEQGAATTAAIYPSIARSGSGVEVVYSLDRPVAGARVTLHDASGRMISTTELDGAAGLHRAPITAPDASGLYFVTIQSGAQRVSQRLIVQ